jgi:hypothetical protein
MNKLIMNSENLEVGSRHLFEHIIRQERQEIYGKFREGSW